MKYALIFFSLIFFNTKASAAAQSWDEPTFAVESYKLISKTPGNIVFSPFSISTAMAMTASGADKQTLAQLTKALHLSNNFVTDYKGLLTTFKSSTDFELHVANRLWTPENNSYNQNYISDLQLNFNSDLIKLDFIKQPEQSRITINKWVEDTTKGKIVDLLPTGSVTPASDMVITNAIYFKGAWLDQFKPEDTKKDTFYNSKSEKKQTEFMNRSGHYHYLKQKDAEVIVLPYHGNELSFVVVLPNENISIANFEKSLSVEKIQTWSAFFQSLKVNLSLPKFKIELPINLVPMLKTLGIKDAFEPKQADFTKIRARTNDNNLFISGVLHKAFIEVNETGSEAAAATAVMMLGTSMVTQKPVDFKANRPFIYYIRHNQTNSILFMGRVSHF